MTIPIDSPQAPGPATPTVPGASPGGKTARPREPIFGEDGFTFRDLLDIINPLQHIPVISTLYRRLTGDEISPGARLAGGGLFGGPLGLGYAMLNNIADDATGRDLGEHVMAFLIPDTPPDDGAPRLAGDRPPPPPAPPAAPQETAQDHAIPGRHGAFSINDRLFNILIHPYPLEPPGRGDEPADRDKNAKAVPAAARHGRARRTAAAYRAAEAAGLAARARLEAIRQVNGRPFAPRPFTPRPFTPMTTVR